MEEMISNVGWIRLLNDSVAKRSRNNGCSGTPSTWDNRLNAGLSKWFVLWGNSEEFFEHQWIFTRLPVCAIFSLPPWYGFKRFLSLCHAERELRRSMVREWRRCYSKCSRVDVRIDKIPRKGQEKCKRDGKNFLRTMEDCVRISERL